MRRLASAAIIFSLFVAFGARAQEQLSATEAKQHEGQKATVCGTVASVHFTAGSRGKPTFINLDQPYPNQVFTALVWGEDRSRVPIPRSGQHVCVTGAIQDYKGSPEIVVRDGSSLVVR